VRRSALFPTAMLRPAARSIITIITITSIDLVVAPRGAFIRLPVRLTVLPVASPSVPVLSSAEWNDLVQVLDEQF
jgi:hypothetical protein